MRPALKISLSIYHCTSLVAQLSLLHQEREMEMAILLRFGATAILVLFTCAISFSDSRNMAYAQCEGDIPSLISQCAKYVRKEGPKIQPSKACCTVAKQANIPCLCKYVTKEVEQYVDIGKAVYVAQYCGIPLQHGSKCGGTSFFFN